MLYKEFMEQRYSISIRFCLTPKTTSLYQKSKHWFQPTAKVFKVNYNWHMLTSCSFVKPNLLLAIRI